MKTVFAALPNCEAWTLQLLKIKFSKQKGTSYIGREISLHPKDSLAKLVAGITDHYINESKGLLNSYHDIMEYNGSTEDMVIFWLTKTNELVTDEYDALINAIDNPDKELDPLKFNANAYVLRGIVNLDGEEKPIKLISMQKPITLLKNKYWNSNGEFKEIPNKVLSLRNTIDVIIMDNTVYMLTLSGEKLFNMERAYNTTCTAKLLEIERCNIVNDFMAFSSVAKSGHNPRKFVSFNEAHLKKLEDLQSRRKMASKFQIPMKGKLFDTTHPNDIDKIIKLLCNRGMVDPFNDNPMEVASSKKWE